MTITASMELWLISFMEIYVSGFFNRGQQNEYVELEAASKCSLEGLMLMRYLYGKYYYTIGHGVFCGGGD